MSGSHPKRYGGVDDKDPLPSWEEASNFTSLLLDDKAWRAFDKSVVVNIVVAVAVLWWWWVVGRH